jgi:DNA polymerase
VTYDLKNSFAEALKDQNEIFGDMLFEELGQKKTGISYANIPENIKLPKTEPAPNNNIFKDEFQKASSVQELNTLICECMKCPLGKTRTKFVFGVGNPHTQAMLIGEAPGHDEDLQGEPFVGRAGKLLNDILKAINFAREDVFIANILKCRPPNNRDPLPLEMETCIPYLYKQIELINPKVILCLGRVAASGLLNKKLSLGQFRESDHEFNGIKVIVTYHPAALLRNPNWKHGCWDDVRKFRKIYDELTAS